MDFFLREKKGGWVPVVGWMGTVQGKNDKAALGLRNKL
jgi:hypothetical protein